MKQKSSPASSACAMLCRLFLVTTVLQTEAFKPVQHVRVATSTSDTPYVLSLKNLQHFLRFGGAFWLAVNEAVLLIIGVFEHLWCDRAREVTQKTAIVLNVENTWHILSVRLRHNLHAEAGQARPVRHERRAATGPCLEHIS